MRRRAFWKLWSSSPASSARAAISRLRRLGADEIAGTPESSGILERYLTLSPSGKTPLQDMRLDPDRMWIGDKAFVPAYAFRSGRPPRQRSYG